MILERKDLTVGAIRKDISLRMGKQRDLFFPIWSALMLQPSRF